MTGPRLPFRELRDPLVERPAVILFQIVVHLAHLVLVGRRACGFVQDNLHDRRHLGAILEMIGVPQAGAPKCFGAMHEDLVHRDDDRKLRSAAVDAHALEQFRIVGKRRPSVHAQRILEAGDNEHQPDARIGDDIDQRIETVVAGAIRDRQRALVENLDETDGIAARTDIGLALSTLRADANERRPPDEFLRMFAQCVLTLQRRQFMGRVVEAAKRVFIAYDKVRIEREARPCAAFRRCLVWLIYTGAFGSSATPFGRRLPDVRTSYR